jgi:hypothetical protein
MASSGSYQVLMCGHPGVSVWSCSSVCSDLSMMSHHRASGVDFSANPSYKVRFLEAFDDGKDGSSRLLTPSR